MVNTNSVLALFDFDGTITRKDTLFEIIKFIKDKQSFYSGILLLAPYLFLFLIRFLPNWKVKERLLRHFFGGMAYALFQQKCEFFVQEILPGLIYEEALKELNKWKKAGARIVVVTASAEAWVAPWCKQLDIECIATHLQVKHARLTGRIEGKNCYGIEKVNRIKAAIDLSLYDEIVAYGDSKGDLPMLQLANRPHYRLFRK